MKTRYNERSWAMDVISEARHILDAKQGMITRCGGETTISTDEGSLFPDILLYEGSSGACILQGWELKMPDTPITAPEFIENATKKAMALGLNSFVLWNVREAVLYQSNDLKHYVPSHAWPTISEISTRKQVQEQKLRWVALLATILDDLERLFRTDALQGRNVIASFADTSIIELLLQNAGAISKNMEGKTQTDGRFAAEVNLWWNTVKYEYPLEEDRFAVLGRLVTVNWVNRFIYAHAIRTRFVEAARVIEITESVSTSTASATFAEISKKCDFWTVFQPFLGENCLTVTFWRQITQFGAFLSHIQFDELDQAVLSAFLESAVESYKRKLAGQYTTPPALADILVRLVLLDKTHPFLDPFCGTGTIARAAYNLKLESGIDHKNAHGTIWASDKFPFPLQVAAIALSPPECMGLLLHVFKADALSLKTGKVLTFIDPNNGRERTESLPPFRFVAANLPFVQQEDLDVTNKGVNGINRFIAKLAGKELCLDPRSDLLAYLPFHLWQLLTDDGRLGVIVSNAWLATDWGMTFREVLSRFFQVEKIIISGDGRWFGNADVVTTLLILNKRPSPSEPSPGERTAFIRIDKRLQDCSPGDETRTIAELSLLDRSQAGTLCARSYSQSAMRDHESLGMQWSSLFADLDWLPGIRDKLVKVSSIFRINRGERRGWDPMFFPGTGHGIESEYLEPVLKTSKSVEGLIANPDALAFCCDKDIAQLRHLGHRGAIRWIGRFEHATNEKGKPLPKALVRGQMQWYQMNPSTLADLVMLINYDRRLFVARLQQRSFVNQRLTRLTAVTSKTDIPLCHALLNSILGVFYIEALGFGRGLGVLDLNSTKMQKSMFMLNPNAISSQARSDILTAFKPLLKRPVEPISDELARPDRRQFDEIVLSAYGLECYESIREAFLTLYGIRKAVE